MWGVAKPYNGSFASKDREDFLKRNKQARRERGRYRLSATGACSLCPWEYGYEGVEFDALEVWNGANEKG